MRFLPLSAAVMALCLLFSPYQSLAAEGQISAEDILKRHLDSIGDSGTRSAAKSRVIEGTASYRVLVGGSGQVEGKAVLVSDTDKMHLLLKINAQQYNGEQFVRDGNKTYVAGTYQDKSRSEFGTFLRAEDVPLREGLLGGVLTTGWSLLDLEAHKGKLKYQGMKKIDGIDLYAVSYKPKKSSDMDITLYFEPETFRHVRTIYAVSQHGGLGSAGQADVMADPAEVARVQQNGSDVNSARQQQTRYRIEERFSDFKTADGLTLPSHYDLRFQEELQNGFTKTVDWDVTTTRVLSNVPVDARNFQTH